MTDEIVRLRAERDAAVAALAEVRAALGVEGNGSVVLAVELLKRRAEQAVHRVAGVLLVLLRAGGTHARPPRAADSRHAPNDAPLRAL